MAHHGMQTYLPGFFFLFFPFASSHSSTSVWHTGTFSTLHPIYQHTNNTQVQLIKLTQLSPLLPPRQSIYPPHYLFKFYVCPPLREWEKLFPEKRIIIICGTALESNVLESWSNYRLWQMGPAASTLLLRSPRRPTDKCRGITTYTLSHSYSCSSTEGCQVTAFI